MQVLRLLALPALAGCSSGGEGTEPPDPSPTVPIEHTADTGAPEVVGLNEVLVSVTLDGEPVGGAWVGVGGGMNTTTDPDGFATVTLDGGQTLVVSHPESRTLSATPSGPTASVALLRFSRVDNPEYVFEDPGVAGELGDTSQCGHCHGSMVIDWTASPHRAAASNPVVHDVFAGTGQFFTESTCVLAGGVWREGIGPGTTAPADRCYLGDGTLPDLNDDCGVTVSCDAVASNTGGCADCHAPGVDGVLGGRSLLDAQGRSFTEGVHCDVCHKAESIDLGAPAGVAGALGILRPSEPGTSPVFEWDPLTFGPYPDVPNPRMGAVQRDHFRSAEFCAACHELTQPAQVDGEGLDPVRWPAGLPVHSTYSEWLAGAFAESSPCQSCHMPPDPRWGNAAELTEATAAVGLASGWWRAPGSVRRHLWDGPRGAEGLLDLAAALDLSATTDGGTTTVVVTTRNVGAGHAIPTGEPMRSLVLVVEARCGPSPLLAVGGDVVPSFGGALDERRADEDWSLWPGASVGDRIRVVSRAGWRDYSGPGPFGDGTFDVAAKGLPIEEWLGEAMVVSVSGDTVLLDAVLPPGDVAYRVDGSGLPSDGETSRAWAGAPGFAFARVLADAQGNRQVAHHRAVDIVSDNRLMPLQSAITTHRFAATCAEPVVTARLIHRPYPLAEARLRQWDARDQVMAEVTQ